MYHVHLRTGHVPSLYCEWGDMGRRIKEKGGGKIPFYQCCSPHIPGSGRSKVKSLHKTDQGVLVT